MPKCLQSLFAIVLVACAGLVHAQSVTYTFTGSGNGTVGGVAFTGQTYTFTLTALAATVQNSAFPYSNVLTGGTITVTGTACAGGCTIDNPGDYLVFNTGPTDADVHGISLVGELDLPGSTLLEGCWQLTCGGPLVDDNLVTPVPPSPSGQQGAEAPYLAFPSSGGVVQITVLDGSITYSVVAAQRVAAAGAVPTLSPFGLVLLAALLVLGVAAGLPRRR